MCAYCFFLSDAPATEIYTLSLHDALPISGAAARPIRRASANLVGNVRPRNGVLAESGNGDVVRDRKSTRLNSSHANISYAVFCLKKKNHKLLSQVGSASAPHSITDAQRAQ